MSYKKVNILALSGGGIRGILTASLINQLNDKNDFLTEVDMFSGTSTGSIVASALALGYSPERIIQLFQNKGHIIFKYGLIDKIRSIFGLYSAKYSHEGLLNTLLEEFGEVKMGEVKKSLLISSFDLGSKDGRPYRAKYFSNFTRTGDCDLRVVDCVVASCSAPTYFPAYKIFLNNRYHQFVDGGIACNHPAMSAIAAAMDSNGLDAYPEDIACLAVGTGVSKADATGWGKRGILGWLPSIIELALEQYSTVNYQAAKILKADYRHGRRSGERFRILNPRLEEQVKMDSVKAIPRLLDIANHADAQINSIDSWISQKWGRVPKS